MANNEATFQATLELIGFSENAVEALGEEGISTMADLTNLSESDIDELGTHVTMEGRLVRGATVATRQKIPFLVVKKLKAFHAWGQFLKLKGKDADPDDFDVDDIGRWLNRLNQVASISSFEKEQREVPKLSKFDDWPVWDEKFRSYLRSVRSVEAHTPLTYVIREIVDDADAEGAAEALALLAEDRPLDVDDNLVKTRILEGPSFAMDNKRVYEVLVPLIMDGPGRSFIQKFDKTTDGRGAYLTLKLTAEGTSAQTTRKAQAYSQISSARYTGKGNFTFEQYVARHQTAHNTLELLKEPIPETKKVTDFLKNINDSRLVNAKDHIAGDLSKLESFEKCQQYLKQILSNYAVTTEDQRKVAAVGHADHGGSKKEGNKKSTASAQQGKKRKKREDDSDEEKVTVHAGYYSSKDYGKLTAKQRQEVRKLRAAKDADEDKTKSNPSKRSVASVASICAVSSSEPEVPRTPKKDPPKIVVPGWKDLDLSRMGAETKARMRYAEMQRIMGKGKLAVIDRLADDTVIEVPDTLADVPTPKGQYRQTIYRPLTKEYKTAFFDTAQIFREGKETRKQRRAFIKFFDEHYPEGSRKEKERVAEFLRKAYEAKNSPDVMKALWEEEKGVQDAKAEIVRDAATGLIERSETDYVIPTQAVEAEATGKSQDGEATRSTTEVSSATESAANAGMQFGRGAHGN